MKYIDTGKRTSLMTLALVLLGLFSFQVANAADQVRCDGCIDTKDIAKSAVTNDKIKKGAVSKSKLGRGAVSTSKLADDAVSTSKLANFAVTSIKLDNGAVQTWNIKDGAVNFHKLEPKLRNAIGTSCPAGESVVGMDGYGHFVCESKLVQVLSDGPLDLYVDEATGDDQNDGLSPTTAKLTIQAAVDAVPMVLGGDATVHIAHGTYSEFVWIGRRTRLGIFAVSIVGDEAAPSNVILDGESVLVSAFFINDFYVAISGVSMIRFEEAIGAYDSFVRLSDCTLSQNTDVAVFAEDSGLQMENVVISDNSGTGISTRNTYLEDLTDVEVFNNAGGGIGLSASKLGGEVQVHNNGGVGVLSSESSHVNFYDSGGVIIQNNTGGDMKATYASSIRGYENGTTGACQAGPSSVCEP
jgi:hypothetical protein